MFYRTCKVGIVTNYITLLAIFQQHLCVLSQEDEDRVSKLIEEIGRQVREKRILTYPYFQDYDMVSQFFITVKTFTH